MIFNLVFLHIEDNEELERLKQECVVNSFQISIFAH